MILRCTNSNTYLLTSLFSSDRSSGLSEQTRGGRASGTM